MAERLGLGDGDLVDVVGRESRVRGVVHVNGVHPGLVATTELFGRLATILDSSGGPDPMQHAERLRLLPVRLEPVSD